MSGRTLVRARPRQPRAVPLQSDTTDLAWLYGILGVNPPSTHLPVTDQTVRGLPAAWAALAKISNAVGTMMSDAECYAADGRTSIDCPPVVDQPDVTLDKFTYWKMVAATAITQGNFIGVKADFDAFGYPRQVIAVPPGSVAAHYDEHGFVVYEIGGENYAPDELVHVRVGVTIPGQVMTVGVIEAHRRGLAGMLAQQGMANDVWSTGAVPSGIVQLDVDNPTAAQASTVKSNWISVLDGRRTVAVTGKRMSYTPITWNADDAQFIESQQFSVAMIALMFGLHPSDLDASIGGSGLTYANRQDNALERITESYTPVLLPIEQAWSGLIPGRNFVRGDVEALLRSTPKERLELHSLAQAIGLETVDETREAEGKPPAPEPPPPPNLPPPEPHIPSAEPPPVEEEVIP